MGKLELRIREFLNRTNFGENETTIGNIELKYEENYGHIKLTMKLKKSENKIDYVDVSTREETEIELKEAIKSMIGSEIKWIILAER